jgi:hypothetical protein
MRQPDIFPFAEGIRLFYCECACLFFNFGRKGLATAAACGNL